MSARLFSPFKTMRGTSRIASAVGLLATLGLCAMCAIVLKDLRDSIWLRAEQNSLNILRVIEQDIARNVEVFDLSLRAVMDAIDDPAVAVLSPELRSLVLFDRAATAKYLGAIMALDANGNVTAESRSPIPRTDNYAHRDYFQHHVGLATSALYISLPYTSPHSGDLAIGLSRRLTNPDGSFGGVVVGTMRLAYFEHLFNRVAVGKNGSVNLFRTDGTLLMRQSDAYNQIGRSFAGAETFRRFSSERSGTFVGQASIDRVERFYTFSHVGDLPLILNVALSVEEIFADWRQKAFLIGLVVLGLGAVTGTLTVLLHRELRQREAAESRVLAANVELAELASTDPLTGLANRRRFDQEMGRAWIRNARSDRPLGLLLIDADNFKRFNDRYGHAAGDEALKALGSTLSACLRQHTDVASRIGGEEFAVLLPGAGWGETLAVADRILAGLRDLNIPHAGNPAGVMTVSIGAASIVPGPTESETAFLARADVALYAAKRHGRNQVAVAETGIPDRAASAA